MVGLALDECGRDHPAFAVATGGDKSPAETVRAGLVEPPDEA